jgi:hypothetical protein
VLDPQELTEDITPAADRVSGKLNMHNFDQGVVSTVAVDEEAYYTIHHYKQFSPFLWTAPVPFVPPWDYPDGSTVASTMALIQNNFEWQAIIDGAGTATEVSFTTGQSVLWVNAYAQYVWWGFNYDLIGGTRFSYSQHFNGAMSYPCNLQFALRINGNVINETITGIDDLTYRASVPIKPLKQRGEATGDVLPGPQDIRSTQVCALGPPCLPIRLGACVPCVPGPQTVELVVRRVPYVADDDVRRYGSVDRIYVYNRQVNVVELKSFPIDSVGPAETTAPALETEDTLNQAALYTNRVQPIIAAYNDVQEGALARGALMHYHLPSALRSSAFQERGYSGDPFNNWYPGWIGAQLNTVTTTRYSGLPGVGWCVIATSANTGPLQINALDVSQSCKVLVIANLQIRNVKGPDVDFPSEAVGLFRASSFSSFALFQLMYQNQGASATTWTSAPESMGMVNNFVWWPKAPGGTLPFAQYVAATNPDYGVEHAEIQLMALLDFTTPQATPINVAMFGCVSGQNVECSILRGNIMALVLRA